jgi:hypothetical protein
MSRLTGLTEAQNRKIAEFERKITGSSDFKGVERF